jgi:hypothetical protein
MAKNNADLMSKVLAVATREEAAKLVNREIGRMMRTPGGDRDRLRRILLSNIGYMAYYYDAATADRILDLFETEHPFFGKGHPTPDFAFVMGRQIGKRMKTEAGRAKFNAFMEAGKYEALRKWVMKGICPICFESTRKCERTKRPSRSSDGGTQHKKAGRKI